MKKLIMGTACLLLFATARPGHSQDEQSFGKYWGDVSYMLSFGSYSSDSTISGQVEKWVNTILSLRAGPLVSAGYRLTETIGVGLETGYLSMSMTASVSSGADTAQYAFRFVDVPIRAVALFDTRRFTLKPYIGLYLRNGSGDQLGESVSGTHSFFDIGCRGGKLSEFWFLEYMGYAELELLMGGGGGEMRGGLGLTLFVR